MSIFKTDEQINLESLESIFFHTLDNDYRQHSFAITKLIEEALQKGTLTAIGTRVTSNTIEKIPREEWKKLHISVPISNPISKFPGQAILPEQDSLKENYSYNCWEDIHFYAKEIIEKFNDKTFAFYRPDSNNIENILVWPSDTHDCYYYIDSTTPPSSLFLMQALTLIAYGIAFCDARFQDRFTPLILSFRDQETYENALFNAWAKLKDKSLNEELILKGKKEGTTEYVDIPANYFEEADIINTSGNKIKYFPLELGKVIDNLPHTNWDDVKIRTAPLRQAFPQIGTPIFCRHQEATEKTVNKVKNLDQRRISPNNKKFLLAAEKEYSNYTKEEKQSFTERFFIESLFEELNISNDEFTFDNYRRTLSRYPEYWKET